MVEQRAKELSTTICKAGTIPNYLHNSDLTEAAEKVAPFSHDEFFLTLLNFFENAIFI